MHDQCIRRIRRDLVLLYVLLSFTNSGIKALAFELSSDDNKSATVSLDDISDFADLDLESLLEEEIVYSVGRTKRAIGQSPSAITVIVREQIENTHCMDVVCLLRQVPELQVREIKPMYTAVGARAMVDEMGDKALVMIDGREINFEPFGMTFWGGLPVHLEDIERIEIIRGPGSALYGANAHSLVVSIVTRTPKQTTGQAFIAGGEHGRLSFHVSAGTVLDDWKFSLAGGGDTASHWRIKDKREREVYRLRLKVERDDGASQTGLNLGVVSAEGQMQVDFMPFLVNEDYRIFGNLTHKNDWLSSHLWFHVYNIDVSMDFPLIYQGMEVGEFPKWLSILTTTLSGEEQGPRRRRYMR